MSQLSTVEEIAADVIAKLTLPDRERIRRGTEDAARALHFSLGMWIRNTYGLWTKEHPLTKTYMTDPASRKIVDGVDVSEGHPDAVSDRIIRCIWKKLQE